MTPGSIGRRYARALFELARENAVVDDVGSGLVDLATTVDSLDTGSLAPGTLPLEQRRQLAATMAASSGKDSLLGRFLGVLADNDRLEALPAISRGYQKLQDEAAGRLRAQIRSAFPLSEAERTAIRQRLEAITGRRVLDTAEVDPALLGGVSIEAEGRVYDGSIRTQLTRLERRMAG